MFRRRAMRVFVLTLSCASLAFCAATAAAWVRSEYFVEIWLYKGWEGEPGQWTESSRGFTLAPGKLSWTRSEDVIKVWSDDEFAQRGPKTPSGLTAAPGLYWTHKV